MDCTLCYDQFNQTERQPMILPCGHSFCKLCIDIVEQKNGVGMECPFKCKMLNQNYAKARINITVLDLIKKKKIGNDFYQQC